ncbi:MAG: HAMP domain-containing histidine kinase [Ardenticatenaceae bacterium]|nr:HAMP domain-containing histidine kinase [Ardenticatenaceae bacterium]
MLTWRNIYSTTLSLLGAALVFWGLIQIPTYSPLVTFFLLIILAVAAKSTTTHLVQGSALVAVNSAISLSTVPSYGPFAAAVVAATAELSLWLISIYTDKPDWKRAAERLGVNVGMNSIAIFLGGLIFLVMTDMLGEQTFFGQTMPWLFAAIVADQVNLWLLAIIIYLTQGISPMDVWRKNRWAIPINVLTMSIGGGLLHVTVSQFSFVGIAIFFLPILLAAYSYRVIVNNNKRQMEELEGLVAERTRDLAKANEELERLHREKDAFIGVLTHDMRTPLTSIKGYGSILRGQELPRAEQIHIMDIILRSQDNLLELVNNILEIQKLQSGAPILLERSQFELDVLVQMVVEFLQAEAARKQMILTYEAPPTPIYITADRQKIQRVVTNLVANAVKYTPNEGTIQVRLSENGRYAITEIEDNGYGIPPEQLPYIFERFRRVPGHQRKATGTGLGLAIVKSLVEAHGGEVSVSSEEDVGSIFTLKLPLQVEPE